MKLSASNLILALAAAANVVHGRDAAGHLRTAGGEDADVAERKLASSFDFGPHAVDQCDNPVAVAKNFNHNIYDPAKELRIPARADDGSCDDNFCIGDCVTVIVKQGGLESKPINVIAGYPLPDPGNCSSEAAGRNDPPGWDFTHNGKCGKGDDGRGYWHNCFVHDTCVWARCTADDVIPGGWNVFDGDAHGGYDHYCGDSFDDAQKDWSLAHNVLKECHHHSECEEPYTCDYWTGCVPKKDRGGSCVHDHNCKSGICVLLFCKDGRKGDRCEKNNDCQSGLSCMMDWGLKYGGGMRCMNLKQEGQSCAEDDDCAGYCQLLQCWDGSPGDKCGKDNDCQSGDCVWDGRTLTHRCTGGSGPSIGGGDCMAGSTRVTRIHEEKGSKLVEVRDLKIGDKIKGLDEKKQEAVCNVVSVFQSGKGKLFGNYTKGHYVHDEETGSIMYRGKVGEKSVDDMYDVITDCPLGVDESGVGFTGISKNFCKAELSELSWREYLNLHAGLLSLILATGIHDYSAFQSLEKAKQNLSGVCKSMIKCIRAGGKANEEKKCAALERKSKVFYEEVLTEEARMNIGKKIKARGSNFPGVGAGAITQVVARGII